MTDKIDPAEQMPDLRRSVGYLMKRLREGVTTNDLVDACDWVDRSFADDPLARVVLDTIEPDSLVLVWPAEKVDHIDADQLRKDLSKAMQGRFVGVVFPDPGMKVEHIPEDALSNLGLVRLSKKMASAYDDLHRAAMARAEKGPNDFKASTQLDEKSTAFGKVLVEELK